MGGNVVKDECESNPVFQAKEYRVTSGGNSQFANIVHFVPTKVDDLAQNLEQVLHLINDNLKRSSVAIPAIGTGNKIGGYIESYFL